MNPEFQRNLWLETGPRRLAWTVVVLAALFGAAVMVAPQTPARTLGVAGVAVFLVAGLIWGSRAAGRAVADEVIQRTWDFQRLSALTPWSMTWGKLFGSASLAWIAALVGLVVAMGAAVAAGSVSWAGFVDLLGAAVLLQAGSMALALVGVRRARAEGRAAGFRFTFGGLVGLLLALWALSRVLPTRGQGVGGPLDWLTGGLDAQTWWGVSFGGGWFTALSLSAFAAWALVGAWRLMRLELQVENFPWAWPGFVVFAGVWAAGTVAADAALRFAVAGGVFALCAYAAAFAEPGDRVRLRQFAQRLGERRLMSAAYLAPAAVGPVKLALLAVVGVALSPHGSDLRTPSGTLALAAFVFLVRDLGVIAYFRFGPRPGRGDFGAVLGLVLAYFIGGIVGRQLGGATGAALFMPSAAEPAISVAAGAVQAVAIWILAWNRIREPERSEV